ncbi:hypothetical protein Taro_051001 [Colocasia esculenta]|uniref:Uncharacterized protein n=1 Tax=Colocasia esculenta TaxID=4460 RepID=A0A843XEU7_COLES|nr:hypothetical protein [Colocasia esculenta]
MRGALDIKEALSTPRIDLHRQGRPDSSSFGPLLGLTEEGFTRKSRSFWIYSQARINISSKGSVDTPHTGVDTML